MPSEIKTNVFNYKDASGWWHYDTVTHIRKVKGGNVQTEIDYRETSEGIEFVAFRNVLDLNEIDHELGDGKSWGEGSWYVKYIGGGRAFYSLFNKDGGVVRIYGDKEINLRDEYGIHYKDYIVGKRYCVAEWNYFIQWLKDAGKRFTEIKRNKNKVHTIVI